MKRKTIAAVVLILTFSLLTGCGSKREKEAKALAEDYLTKLKDLVAEETLSLSEVDAEQFGELYVFTAYSEKFNDDFKISVNADDKVTDSYFAVSLRETVKEEFEDLLNNLEHSDISYELSIDKNVASSALSGKLFNSIQEVNHAVLYSAGFLQIDLTSKLPEEKLAMLFSAMQYEGLYGKLVQADDVRVFHISPDEITYTRTDDPAGKSIMYYEYE